MYFSLEDTQRMKMYSVLFDVELRVRSWTMETGDGNFELSEFETCFKMIDIFVSMYPPSKCSVINFPKSIKA